MGCVVIREVNNFIDDTNKGGNGTNGYAFCFRTSNEACNVKRAKDIQYVQ